MHSVDLIKPISELAINKTCKIYYRTPKLVYNEYNNYVKNLFNLMTILFVRDIYVFWGIT